MFRGLDCDHYIKAYFVVMTRLLKDNGTEYTVKALKTMRLHITRYLCGQPLYVNDCKVGVDRDG